MTEYPESMKQFERWVIRLLPVFYLVGLIGHGIEAAFELMLALTPYTILGTAVIGLAPFFMLRHTRLLLWAVITFAATLFLEILGVKTGLVFGSYLYGDTLGFEVLGVPLLIGINWTVIILGSVKLAEQVTERLFSIMTITALIAVLFDYSMEPVAMALDYWNWEGGVIPLQNYAAWGVIAFIFAGVYKLMDLRNPSWIPTAIVIVQGLFFLGLRILVI